MRRRSVLEPDFETMLRKLGADLPPWRRERIPESELLGGADRREVVAALERFARTEGVLVHIRTIGGQRYWLLASGPPPTSRPAALRTSRQPTDPEPFEVLDELRGHADQVDEDDHAIRDAAPLASPARGERLPQDSVTTGSASDCASRMAQILSLIGIRVVEVNPRLIPGPNSTRFEVLLHPNERTETLRRRAEDIGRELGASIQISHVPGRRHVAIDVQREDRQIVSLFPALEGLERGRGPGELRILIGVTPVGEPVTVDLAGLPHMLVAGASGSGKSVWLLTALLCLALSVSADELDLLIVDPKGLDFGVLGALPHLRDSKIIEDPAEAIELLRRLTGEELAARTQLLQKVGCVNFGELRARHPDIEAKNLVVAIDEYADIVTSLPREAREDFERQVLRLAQRARAVGIHLVIATQRPTVDLITGAVKANLPSRISFRLPQRTDSLVILDQPGAEALLGAGDMLFLHGGALQRLQGYFASPTEAAELIKRIAERSKP